MPRFLSSCCTKSFSSESPKQNASHSSGSKSVQNPVLRSSPTVMTWCKFYGVRARHCHEVGPSRTPFPCASRVMHRRLACIEYLSYPTLSRASYLWYFSSRYSSVVHTKRWASDFALHLGADLQNSRRRGPPYLLPRPERCLSDQGRSLRFWGFLVSLESNP